MMPAIVWDDEAAEHWTETLGQMATYGVAITRHDGTEFNALIEDSGTSEDEEMFYGISVRMADEDFNPVGDVFFLRCYEFTQVKVY